MSNSFDDDLELELSRFEEAYADFGLFKNELLDLESDTDIGSLGALYLLRMLTNHQQLGALYEKCWSLKDADEDKFEAIRNLSLPIPRSAKKPEKMEPLIRRAWRAAQEVRGRLEADDELEVPRLMQSIEAFRSQLALSQTECDVLCFTAVLHGVGWFRTAVRRTFGEVSNRRAIRLIARAIGGDMREVAAAVSRESKLMRSGLITWDPDPSEPLMGRLLCADALPRALLVEGAGPNEFLTRQCRLAPATRLDLDDFSYLDTEVWLLRRLLKRACMRRSEGVNIFLYGEPGSGKTELVRVLASALGLDLWEVGCRDDDDGSVSSETRLAYLRFAQSVLHDSKKALLLFDEAEDVFDDGLMSLLSLVKKPEKTGKAWFNQLLESNPVPTIWLSNSTRGVDPAHMRRFTYVLEVPRPPRAARRKILKRELGTVGVPDDWLERISADERLVPGHIARTRRLIEHLGNLEPEQARQAAEQGLVNTLRATRTGRRLKGDASMLTRYRPDFIHADADLDELARGVAARGAGRLCFYGPPGTGKSAFGRYLAESAGKSLIYRRASDLLSMWVGGTEENIARMFEEAEQERAAILLDEADSFLAAREGAARSWEVTQVNELLTQMEGFEGLFMASTNLMDRLDHASLRRFDQKIYFGYLQPHQSRALLLQVLKEHGIRPRKTDRVLVEQVASLSNLTPGDFAAVIRRARLSADAAHVRWWVSALIGECELKPDMPSMAIGFLN